MLRPFGTHALCMVDFALYQGGSMPPCTGIFAFRSYGTLRDVALRGYLRTLLLQGAASMTIE